MRTSTNILKSLKLSTRSAQGQVVSYSSKINFNLNSKKFPRTRFNKKMDAKSSIQSK